MWSYYGSKSKLVKYYPPPKYGKIIEPFAGTARYSLKYFDRDILLVDKYEVIVRIWKWLQVCSKQDILGLPRPKETDLLSSYNLSDEEKLLMGFLIAKAVQSPRNKPTARATTLQPNNINYQLKFIANNLHKIKHWKIQQGDYMEIPNQQATWFIDPPYYKGGHVYPCGNKKLDYKDLAEWSQSLQGQVIVCENMAADWLPFYPLRELHGSIKITTEAIWSNLPHDYQRRQLELF